MAVNFHNEDIKYVLPDKRTLKTWIKEVIVNEQLKQGDINFIFCSDEYLLKMNQEYLQHDYLTDVITFDYREGKTVSGDIFISIDRIKENAETYSKTFEEELYRIMVHGVLHLIGFDDKIPEKKEIMTAKEDEYLGKLREISR